MTDSRLRCALTVLLVLAAACTQKKPGYTVPQITRIDPTTCATTTPGEDSTAWQLVSSDQFTFCLPSQWKVSGNEATLGDASLRWGTGERPQGAVITGRVSVPAGGFGREPRELPSQPPMPPGTSSRRADEDIGGKTAQVWHTHVGTKFGSIAQWSMPRVWIVGSARSEEEAELEMVVIRSMRFPIR